MLDRQLTTNNAIGDRDIRKARDVLMQYIERGEYGFAPPHLAAAQKFGIKLLSIKV